MCTENQLAIITKSISEEAKTFLGEKLESVILFGSYARGDYDNESDIDVMVMIDCDIASLENYSKFFNKLSSSLSLEHDITVSIVLRDAATFRKFKNTLPFYTNIEKEGVRIA